MIKNIKYRLLLKKYRNRIFSYCMLMLRNRMDAEDAAQEVFIRIWQNLEKINTGSAAGYIMRITHNLCIDYIRRRKSVMETELMPEEEHMSVKYGFEVNEISTALLKEKISEAIDRLPETLKSVFVLYEIEGLKYKDISEALGMPMNSVKVYLLRARKKLQESLKDYKYEVL